MFKPTLRSLVLAAVAVSTAALVGCGGGASQPPADAKPAAAPKADAAPAHAAPAAESAPAAAAAAPAKEMTQEEMMAAMTAAMTPGEAHQKLDVFVGKWTAATSMWMAPGAPPETSTGTSESKWIYGGRYVHQTFNGTMMGQPFEGQGITGYDNVKKKYFGTWFDTMSTGMMTSIGDYDAAANVFHFDAVMSDPMTGGDCNSKEAITFEGTDKYTMTMNTKDPASGQEFKTLEIVFTRVK